jgi:hypothetical protein
MSALHELLAVEGDLAGTAKRVQEEAEKTFTSRTERFVGSVKTLKMADDARSMEEEAAFEEAQIATTVDEKLDYTWKSLVQSMDAFVQKEATNQTAKADIIVDGNTLISDVPVTALLGFETKLARVRRMYEVIPTLQPGTEWIQHSERSDVWIAKNPEVRTKTEKEVVPVELSPATKEHPAQVTERAKESVVGVFNIKRSSGMISPTRKSVLLGRIDKLIRAVKQARMRANKAEVLKVEMGNVFKDFIHA